METYLTVLALAALPAVGNFLGGLLTEIIRFSHRSLSWALHAAAGIVLAIIGLELMGEALEVDRPWIVVLAFAVGGVVAIGIDWLTDYVTGRMSGSAAETGPWMIYIGTAVDLFSDGIMIGTGSTLALGLALLLAAGQVPADIPEGFATVASFKNAGLERGKRLLLSASFAIPIFLGATLGYWAVRGQGDLLKFTLLVFTAGILFTVAIEEMITEAHNSREEAGMDEDPIEVLALIGGFALFALISAYFGE